MLKVLVVSLFLKKILILTKQDLDQLNFTFNFLFSKIPLGTFVKFDPKNDPNGPYIDGFPGGMFPDSVTPAYVAFGDGQACNNQFQAPCGLLATGSSPTCKIPCGASEVLDSTSVYYLQSNPDLQWVSTSTDSMLTVPNALKLVGPDNLMFGRALINNVYVFGKVLAGNGNFGFEAVTSSGAVKLTSGFDILTCYKPCSKLIL